MEIRDSLLQPTLGHDSPATSIYSATTGYFVSFAGGPLAGAAVALANAYRLKRLGSDWPLGLIAIAMTAIPLGWLSRGGSQWISSRLGAGMTGVGFRMLGLAFFALVYQWHRRYYRNMAILGLKPPAGWVIGIAAVIAGLAGTYGLSRALS